MSNEKKNDGGIVGGDRDVSFEYIQNPDGSGSVVHRVPGISLRDHFAGLASVDEAKSQEYAERLLGRAAPSWETDVAANAEFWADFEARIRYIKADAMIKAREQ